MGMLAAIQKVTLSSGICNPRGCDLRMFLFISFLHDQKRNRTKEKSRANECRIKLA